MRLHTDGFRESGAAGLIACGGDQDNTFGTLGLRGETVVGKIEKSTLTMRAMVGWQHAFSSVAPTTVFSFDGGSPFMIEGVPLARDAPVLDLGLAVEAVANLSISFSYTGQIAQNSTNQSIKGGLAWRF